MKKKLEKELNIKIELYATSATKDRFNKVSIANKVELPVKFFEIQNLDESFLLYNKNKN